MKKKKQNQQADLFQEFPLENSRHEDFFSVFVGLEVRYKSSERARAREQAKSWMKWRWAKRKTKLHKICGICRNELNALANGNRLRRESKRKIAFISNGMKMVKEIRKWSKTIAMAWIFLSSLRRRRRRLLLWAYPRWGRERWREKTNTNPSLSSVWITLNRSSSEPVRCNRASKMKEIERRMVCGYCAVAGCTVWLQNPSAEFTKKGNKCFVLFFVFWIPGKM